MRIRHVIQTTESFFPGTMFFKEWVNDTIPVFTDSIEKAKMHIEEKDATDETEKILINNKNWTAVFEAVDPENQPEFALEEMKELNTGLEYLLIQKIYGQWSN